MFVPSKTKFRKAFKGRVKKVATSCNSVVFAEMGLKVLTPMRINSVQLAAARMVVIRKLGKGVKIWIRIFPNIPRSAKPTDVRMGKGKGAVKDYIARISPGCVIFEVNLLGNDSNNKTLVKEALISASKKLPKGEFSIVFYEDI